MERQRLAANAYAADDCAAHTRRWVGKTRSTAPDSEPAQQVNSQQRQLRQAGTIPGRGTATKSTGTATSRLRGTATNLNLSPPHFSRPVGELQLPVRCRGARLTLIARVEHPEVPARVVQHNFNATLLQDPHEEPRDCH